MQRTITETKATIRVKDTETKKVEIIEITVEGVDEIALRNIKKALNFKSKKDGETRVVSIIEEEVQDVLLYMDDTFFINNSKIISITKR